MTEEQANRLGELIRASRERRGISFRALEEMTGIARTWLVYLEAGRSLEPTADKVARVAEALDVDPAKIDRVTGNYLARSLPTVRTYFRSKGKATQAELDELERVVAEVRAKYRGERPGRESGRAIGGRR